MPTWTYLLIVGLANPTPAAAQDDELAKRIGPLIASHRGNVAVAVKHENRGIAFRRRAEDPMPTASLIKLAVMVEVYLQAAEGAANLDDMLRLTDKDKVPGSGILTQHFSAGATFSLRDATRLMIVYSDNTATNLVLDRIGIGSTAARMQSWGLANTKIHSKVFRRDTSLFPERSKQFGLGSTTADEMIELLEEIHHGRRIGKEARTAMLDHLKACDDNYKFPRFLPPGALVGHKTGSLDKVRTDAGILNTPSGAVFLCVLTSDNADTSWSIDNAGNLLCAKTARAVHDHYLTAK